MSTIVVQNAADSGPGTLRQAIADAAITPETDAIFFSVTVQFATIGLESPLVIEAGNNLSIIAGSGGATGVVISGDANLNAVGDAGDTGLFRIAAGATVTLDGLTLYRGFATGPSGGFGENVGGAIVNRGTLTLLNGVVQANQAIGGSGYIEPENNGGPGGGAAGGILNYGTLNVIGTLFDGNVASGGNGGTGGNTSVVMTTGFTGGRGGHAAGGILNLAGGIVTLDGATFTDSAATGGNGGAGGNSFSFVGGNGGAGGAAGAGVLNFGAISGNLAISTSSFTGGSGGSAGGGIAGLGEPGIEGAEGAMVGFGTAGPDTYAGLDSDAQELYFAGGGNDVVADSIGGDSIFGEAGNDTLTGSNNDNLNGGADDDTIIVTVVDGGEFKGGGGADTLDISQDAGFDGAWNLAEVTTHFGAAFSGFENFIGGIGNETVLGTTGANRLDGGGGADTLSGGQGNDTYVNPTGDTVIEATGSGGGTRDLILSNASYNLASAPNVEDITLTGSANINAVGGTGTNRLTGNSGNNILNGGGGNDFLAGLTGADTLNGGPGNDIYLNPETIDIIGEAAGAPGGLHDRIQTLSSFNISTVANVEDITLVGATNVNAIGNNLANILIGNNGNNTVLGGGGADTIAGGGGNDTMNGGAGADLFKFAPATTGADRIEGFYTTQDRFDLSGGNFSAATVNGADTLLTHSGGTIRIAGVTSLNLTQWNALVVGVMREAPGRPAVRDTDWGDAGPAAWRETSATHADFNFF